MHEKSQVATPPAVTGVHHVAFAVADLDTMTRFYCDMFGLTQIASGEWNCAAEIDALVGLKRSAARFVLLGGANLAIEMFQYSAPVPDAPDLTRPVNRPGITHLAFAVADIHAVYEHMRAEGVRFHAPPNGREPICAAYGRDPEGNVFELLEFRGATPFAYAPATPVWRGQ